MIKLCYREFELGVLSYDKKTEEYVYNSNLNNENNAKEKYIAMEFYYLFNSVNKRSKTLFQDFSVFSGAVNRADIVKEANIQKTDLLYEKLEKLASLDFIDDDFYIKNDK